MFDFKPLKAALIFFLLLFSFYGSSAQPEDPAGDPDVPITGIEVLIGLGGAYGAKKYVQLKKRRRNS
jgi:hypothetical protein